MNNKLVKVLLKSLFLVMIICHAVIVSTHIKQSDLTNSEFYNSPSHSNSETLLFGAHQPSTFVIQTHNEHAQVVPSRYNTLYSALMLLWLSVSALLILALLKRGAFAKKHHALSSFCFTVIGVCGLLLFLSKNPSTEYSPYMASLLLLSILISYGVLRRRLFINNATNCTLLAYASQSGSGASLAKDLSKSIDNAVDIRCISSLTVNCLSQYKQVLFIASTYGAGEPPEKALGFINKLKRSQTFKEAVPFSVLALGDRAYQHFCAFGHQLSALMTEKGGISMSDTAEVHNLDPRAINQWWQTICGQLGWDSKGASHTFHSLRLLESECFNPSQLHRHAHRVSFELANLSYQPGDILEVMPKVHEDFYRIKLAQLNIEPLDTVIFEGKQIPLLKALNNLDWHDQQACSAQELVDQLPPLSPRVYSIASSPYSNKIELLIRRHTRSDNHPGLTSNYLCDLTHGQTANVNVRTHSNFHLPKDDVPLILIAAGTGLAPFIGFLTHRAHQGSKAKHWLFFGEQHKASDFYYQDDIEHFLDTQLLDKFTPAWSRDTPSQYVGSALLANQETLINWQKQGAYIYICGRKQGFGEGALAQLKMIFGDENYQSLIEQRIIRTDLY